VGTATPLNGWTLAVSPCLHLEGSLPGLALHDSGGGDRWAIHCDAGTLKLHNDTSHIDTFYLQSGGAYINQSVDTASQPTLTLVQADVSEGFINFWGTATGVIGAASSEGSVRIEINGAVKRIAYFADA